MIIILCGASSVGKSTLARAWREKHPEYHDVEEIARDIMKESSITRQDLKASLSTLEKSLFLKLQYDIIDEQDRREEELITKEESFISDRGPDPYVYVKMECSNKASRDFCNHSSFNRCMERYRADSLCFILCPLSFPTDDGVRLVPKSRAEQDTYNRILGSIFEQYKIPFIHMDVTDLNKRLSILEDAVRGKFPLPKLPETILNIPFHCIKRVHSCVGLRQVRITSDSIQTSINVFSPNQTNRMIDRYGDDLISLCFDNKVPPILVQTILRPGILFNGVQYNFLGCSSSGLRSRTCYVLKGSKKRIEEVRAECGDFTKIQSVSKRLKRIGMLFSEVQLVNVIIDDCHIHVADDIESLSGDVFTDGCGLIGMELAKQISEVSKIELSCLPSVYQIRYQGCKGVVAINPSIPNHHLVIRSSMKKFNPGSRPFPTIGLCDYSRPYSYGHLNKQYIMLLSGLGVRDEIFLTKQKEHLEYLEKMMHDPEIAIMICCWRNRPGLAAQITKHLTVDSFSKDMLIKRELCRLKSQLLTKIEGKASQRILKIKLRLLINESRNIFGVCDPIGILEYGQCFVRPTIRGKPSTIIGKVTVGKNPCYLLGDIRVLEAIDDPRLHHLVDCIVFPTKGKRPHPSEIAGSDLDGDQYFVCWDKDLIPPKIVEPYEYPSVESGIGGVVDDFSMIDFFSRQNQVSGMMGKLDGYYMFWASKENVRSEKCQQLGKLFSRSVDATKTGDTIKIPHYLVPKKEEFISWQNEIGRRESNDCQVWEKMEYIVIKESEKLKESLVREVLDNDDEVAVSEDFLWDLLEYKAAGISEFEIFLVVRKWCLAQNFTDTETTEKMIQFSEFVNFALFTTDEKLCAIDCSIPLSLVTNALNTSQLLTPSMMQHFHFSDCHSYWNLYFRESSSRFQWKHLLRGLLSHQESMVVLQLSDEMVFAIHFMTGLKFGKQDITPGSIVTYFFSPHFDLYLKRVLSSEYSININNELMQLYQGDERSTFMWIKSESLSKQGETEYDRISVDLTRFKPNIFRETSHPLVNKQSYSNIEHYIKCFNGETGYFDLYEADQPDDLNPVIVEDLDTPLDECPLEDILNSVNDDVLQELTEYSNEVALSCLAASALACDCTSFLKVLQVMMSYDENIALPNIIKHFVHLLTVMVSRYPPSPVPQDTKDTLQIILASLQSLIQTPLDCLCVIDRLCRLKCQELVTKSLMSSVKLVQFQDFCVCMNQWSLWVMLPSELAHIFNDHLNGFYRAMQLASLIDTTNLQDLIDVTKDPNLSKPCHKEWYVAKFLHLLVQHFISEISSTNLKENGKVSRMKAYEHISEDDNSKALIGFRSTQGIAPKMFKQGSHVMISVMMMTSPDNGSIEYHRIAIGQVVQFSRHPTHMVVEVIQPVPNCLMKSAGLGKGHWCLQILGNVTAFKRSSDALLTILDNDSNKLTPLLVNPAGHNDITIPITHSISLPEVSEEREECSSKFNISQQRAIDASLAQRLTLIHGPPGTGKTEVACEIVRRICQRVNKQKNTAVLVTAETNMAVDNLTRKLLSYGIRVVRIGGEGQVSHDIRPVTLEQQVEMKRIEVGKVKRNTKFPETKLIKKILEAAEVIAVTCTGAGDSVLKDFKFQFIVIDEATQAIEPVTLIPIVHHCSQLTLIGDPRQLAPTLPESDDLLCATALKVTLFHRLQKILPSYFLESQYRMHPKLLEFPSANFYDGRLKSAITSLDRTLPFIKAFPCLDKNPLIFIDCFGKEKRIGTSYKNQTEINVIKDVIDELLKCNIPATDIAILTPYIGQVYGIRENVPRHFDISSIDSFQGRERKIVIFSSVRCNGRGNIGFLSDPPRVNVLLTRAKCCLVGIGSRETLTKGSQLWSKWFQDVQVINQDDFKHNSEPKQRPSRVRHEHRVTERTRSHGARPKLTTIKKRH